MADQPNKQVTVKVLKAHCAGGDGNFYEGDRYELPESQARAREHGGLVVIMTAAELAEDKKKKAAKPEPQQSGTVTTRETDPTNREGDPAKPKV